MSIISRSVFQYQLEANITNYVGGKNINHQKEFKKSKPLYQITISNCRV